MEQCYEWDGKELKIVYVKGEKENKFYHWWDEGQIIYDRLVGDQLAIGDLSYTEYRLHNLVDDEQYLIWTSEAKTPTLDSLKLLHIYCWVRAPSYTTILNKIIVLISAQNRAFKGLESLNSAVTCFIKPIVF